MPVAEHPTPTVRGHKTICLPCSQEQYERIVEDPQLLREFLDQQIEANEQETAEAHAAYLAGQAAVQR